MRTLMFPEDDSHDEFWVYHGTYGPADLIFMWALTPFVSEESYQKALQKLKNEHGVDIDGRYKQKKIDYFCYVIGTNGEKFRNVNPLLVSIASTCQAFYAPIMYFEVASPNSCTLTYT